MDNTEMFTIRKWLLQEPLVSVSKQTSSNQDRSSKALVVMDNTQAFHKNKDWLLQKPLVSYSNQTSADQYRQPRGLVVMDNIETFHHKRMVVSETIGFKLEAHFFNSVPIIIGFGCHAQHWVVSPQEKNMQNTLVPGSKQTFKSVQIIIGCGCHAQHWNVSIQEHGCCRNRWFQFRSTLCFKSMPMIISFLFSRTTLRRFKIRIWKPTSSNQYRSS